MKIGITGATGQLGRLVVEHLKSKVDPKDIIALVRTPEKATDLGVEVRAFDYDQPTTLAVALEGVDRLLLISSSEVGKRLVQHENVVNAAKDAGVGLLVYTSLLHGDTSTLTLAPEHLGTEALIKGSGLSFTLLRNGWYTENYTASVPGAVQAGAFIGCAGEGKISSAARTDYAEAAAVVLSTGGHEGKVYELAGDEAYTLTDLAAKLSDLTGQSIPYTDLPEEEYAKALEQIGLPAVVAQAFASYDKSASNGDLFDDGKQLSSLIERPTTSLETSIKAVL